MTGRRRVPLVSRVCTGTFFLLLFATIAANTTKDPPTKLSTLDVESDATISERNETIPNKIGSRGTESTGIKNEAVDPLKLDSKTGKHLESVGLSDAKVGTKDGKAEKEEKVPIPSTHEDAKLQGSRSFDQLDRSSSGDSSIGSKLEELIYGTSGKSSSTRTLSEDVHRLSRTNGLSTVTAKPASEEGKTEERSVEAERSNVTSSSSEIPRSSMILHRLDPEGDERAEGKKERSEVVDSSPQKVRFLEEEEEEVKKASKNSEVAGLKEEGGAISLINDTYVNYSHRYKTSTAEPVASSLDSENGTNFITEESTVVTHHPKEEVEVVGNVTQPAIQRIVEPRSRNATSKDLAGLGNESSEIGSIRNEDYSTSQDPATNETSRRSIEIQREPSEKNRRQKLVQLAATATITTTAAAATTTIAATEGTFREESSTTWSPVPRGRTIAFDVSSTSEEGKPYPYAKSSAKESVPDSSNRLLEITTEEGSALENTIGRSEEKLIVTEASDVLENSIQQLKPAYRDKGSSNESSSTLSSTIPTTTTTVAPVPRESSDRVGERGMEENSTRVGNDVPRWNESRETISGVDVTGNGITEVSARPEESRSDKRAYEVATRGYSESPTSSIDPSTRHPSIERKSSIEDLATTIEQIFVANATTESPATSDGANEIPSSSLGGPANHPDHDFAPTTVAVEYEFVSLSESTEPPLRPRNATEESAEATTVTPPPEESDDPSSSTSEATDRTWIVTTFVPPNWTSRDEAAIATTRASLVVEEGIDGVDDVARTTELADSWTPTGEDEGEDGVGRTISFDSKDTRFAIGNATEQPARFTPIVTDGTVAAITPSIPEHSSTSPSGVPSRKPDHALPARQEITWLVRIVMEGGRYDVCSKMDKLKAILADILQSGMNKLVSHEQIILHENPCQESSDSIPSSSSPSDTTSILVYVVDEKGRFDTNMTKILPSLYEESRDRITFPIKIQRFLLVQETIPDSGNAVAVIVVSSVALICLVLLAGLLFIMRKRQTRFNYGERCRPVSLDAYSLDSVSAYNSVRRKGVARSSKRSYGNPTFEDSSAIPSHPLNFAGLSSFCNDINAINEEFAGIPQVSAKIDELPAGAEVKNRYANVIPLPETRVLLQKINNDPLTEYINASYVRGPKNATKYYVACQAPMDSTVTDFWRMIWEQQSKVIIMLTDLVENGVEKCTEYIPPSEITDCRRLYGDFQVTLKKRETKEKYAISTLHLNNLEKNTFREVYHIWYLWPVNGVQSDGAGLIAVLLEARALQRGGPGPIVVHCSPGTGRTGTLIALDLGIRQYEITRTVDVPRVVYTIRRDRAGAVKTKEQYAFIYKALNLYATKLAGGVLEST